VKVFLSKERNYAILRDICSKGNSLNNNSSMISTKIRSLTYFDIGSKQPVIYKR